MGQKARTRAAALRAETNKGHDCVNCHPFTELLALFNVTAGRVVVGQGHCRPDGHAEERAVVEAAKDSVSDQPLLVVDEPTAAALVYGNRDLSK